MPTRNVLGMMVDLAPLSILPRFLRGLSMQGIRPRFKIGKVWCTFDANHEQFIDEHGTVVTSSADLKKSQLVEIDWGEHEVIAGPRKDLLADTVPVQDRTPGFPVEA